MVKTTARILMILAGALTLSGCGGPSLVNKSACDTLVYKESGLTREEFLPCAGEILALMDELKPLAVEAIDEGDRESRKTARRAYRKLRKLIKKAGGKNLLEEWRDHRLTDLNEALWNAYTHYWAVTRSPNDVDFQDAERNHDEARRLYDSMV